MKRCGSNPIWIARAGVEFFALQAGLGLPFAFQGGSQAAARRLGGTQAGPQHPAEGDERDEGRIDAIEQQMEELEAGEGKGDQHHHHRDKNHADNPDADTGAERW